MNSIKLVSSLDCCASDYIHWVDHDHHCPEQEERLWCKGSTLHYSDMGGDLEHGGEHSQGSDDHPEPPALHTQAGDYVQDEEKCRENKVERI